MRFLIIPLLLLCTPAAYATPSEECLNMARDYLIAVDKNQSDTQIVYARENFLSRCKNDNQFNHKLTQLVVDNKVIKAIHVRQNRRHVNLVSM